MQRGRGGNNRKPYGANENARKKGPWRKKRWVPKIKKSDEEVKVDEASGNKDVSSASGLLEGPRGGSSDINNIQKEPPQVLEEQHEQYDIPSAMVSLQSPGQDSARPPSSYSVDGPFSFMGQERGGDGDEEPLEAGDEELPTEEVLGNDTDHRAGIFFWQDAAVSSAEQPASFSGVERDAYYSPEDDSPSEGGNGKNKGTASLGAEFPAIWPSDPLMSDGRSVFKDDGERLMRVARKWAVDSGDHVRIFGAKPTSEDAKARVKIFAATDLLVPGESESGRLTAYMVEQCFPDSTVEEMIAEFDMMINWHKGIVKYELPFEQFQDGFSLKVGFTHPQPGNISSRAAAQLTKSWFDSETSTFIRTGVNVDLRRYYPELYKNHPNLMPMREKTRTHAQHSATVAKFDKDFPGYDTVTHMPFLETFARIQPMKMSNGNNQNKDDEGPSGCKVQYVTWVEPLLPKLVTMFAGAFGLVEGSLMKAQRQLWGRQSADDPLSTTCGGSLGASVSSESL